MSAEIDAAWLAQKLTQRSPNGIALEIKALIRAGMLPIDTRLPTVRALGLAMGISPATISTAWSMLRRQRMLDGGGRKGIWISGTRSVNAPQRFASTGNFGTGALNLGLATPDPELLPPLASALAHGASAEGLNSYSRVAILPELEAAVRSFWPYDPPALLAMNGGYSAVYSLLNALAIHGARVAIEMPTALRHLDILDDLGVIILPVACDQEGPKPEALRAALAQKPALFLFQPRLHSVTGRTVSPARMRALAEEMRGSDTIVVEDDGLGAVSAAPPQSLGVFFPDRVVHIHSFSKSYGPDLRIAVLSGPNALVDQIRGYRSFSSGWTSRILQSATAWLVKDAATQQCIGEARTVYDQRRAALADPLCEGGVAIEPGHGLCIWVPVQSEPYAMVTLAARGIAVAPGSRFTLSKDNHIRVSTGFLNSGHDWVAEAITLAAAEP